MQIESVPRALSSNADAGVVGGVPPVMGPGRWGRFGQTLGLLSGPLPCAKLLALKGLLRVPLLGPRLARRRFRFRFADRPGLYLRPTGGDIQMLVPVMVRGESAPLEPIASEPLKQIVEIGTNVGIGLSNLAERYPAARLLGVELDAFNVDSARRNTAAYRARCTIVQAAVWPQDGELVTASGDEGPSLLRPSREVAAGASPVSTVTMGTLLARHFPTGQIDYLHCDIVGGEPEILHLGAEWIKRIRSLKIQLYPDRGFTSEAASELLTAVGMCTSVIAVPSGAVIFAYRPRTGRFTRT